MYELFTIGFSWPHGSQSGAWGFRVLNEEIGLDKIAVGVAPFTTNHRVQILAAVKGLSWFSEPSEIKLYTDSNLLIKAILLGELENWRQNKYRYRNLKQVPYRDLWCCLDDLLFVHNVFLFRPNKEREQTIMSDLGARAKKYASILLKRCKGEI